MIKQRQVESPLDTLTGCRRSPTEQAKPKIDPQAIGLPVFPNVPRSMGRLRIELQSRPADAEAVPVADVTLTILTNPSPVQLTGIVVREARPGWLTLDVPPLERRAEPMRRLTPQQRDRIESAEFYELMQREVARRLLHHATK